MVVYNNEQQQQNIRKEIIYWKKGNFEQNKNLSNYKTNKIINFSEKHISLELKREEQVSL